jgi:UDP:flavonoid glycosyltransferase YjiC (YdhE family)
VRVLATSQPAVGHLHPIIPLLHALAEDGHEVRLASAAQARPWVEQAGLTFEPAGIDWLESRYGETFPEIVELRGDPPRLLAFMMDLFTRRTAVPMARDLAATIDDWRPDLLLHTKAELGGPAAAQSRGVPHVPVWAGADDWQALFVPNLAGTDEALAAVGARARHGDPGWLTAAGAVLVEPPGWSRVPDDVAVTTMRPDPFDATQPPSGEIDWLQRVRHPFALVTLGTVYNKRPGLLAALVAGAASRAAEVLVTLGPGVDPSATGPIPEHVRVESYVPLSAVLPHCDVVIAHAGWNTVVGAALAGVPMVALVIGADHAQNARPAAAAGWARVIRSELPTADDVEVAVHQCLTEPAVRGAADAQRVRLLAQPTAHDVAAVLADRFGSAP